MVSCDGAASAWRHHDAWRCGADRSASARLPFLAWRGRRGGRDDLHRGRRRGDLHRRRPDRRRRDVAGQGADHARDVGGGVLAAAGLVAARGGGRLEDLLPSVERFGLGTTAVTNVLASRTGRSGRAHHHHRVRGDAPLRPGAGGSSTRTGGCRPARIVPHRHASPRIDERIDRDGARPRAARHRRGRRRSVAAPRRGRGRRGRRRVVPVVLPQPRPRGPGRRAAITEALPELPVVSGAALHPAIREFERTTYAVLNAYARGALAGVEELGDELAALGPARPAAARALRRRVDHRRRGAPPAARPGRVRAGGGRGRRRSPSPPPAAGRRPRHLRHGRHVVRRRRWSRAGGPARRTRGRLMGVWTALSLVDVESIGAGGGSIAWVDARGDAAGRARVGRRGTGARLLRPRRGATRPSPMPSSCSATSTPTGSSAATCARRRRGRSRRARRLGRQLGLGAEETAWGIRRLALAGMIEGGPVAAGRARARPRARTPS